MRIIPEPPEMRVEIDALRRAHAVQFFRDGREVRVDVCDVVVDVLRCGNFSLPVRTETQKKPKQIRKWRG
jgi:hypothetical protein